MNPHSLNPYMLTSAAVLLVLFAIELHKGFYRTRRMNWNDRLINVVSFAHELVIVRPFVVFATAWVLGELFPAHTELLAGVPFWPALILFLVSEDLVQYWWHRKGHEWNWLWKIHKVHHSATEMSVAVTARGNILWFLLMPTNYYAAAAVYFGLGEVYLLAYAIKAVINFLSHTGLRWDLHLLEKFPWISPIWWGVERTVTTADTHHAHHGMAGEMAQPMGNYAPVFFLWDVIFGTAKIPRTAQQKIGIEKGGGAPWYEQLYWNQRN